ncbi:argininosuccinate lyase [Prosthecochloris sp. SCSIO W1101]|uniref:argininosuccinate lyase n=1 Tax=Prosthecochloris sp. SCSIO W1101 TaxID=2992242 RepID=UPI00223D3507|nr:argininosuccinate lyase [Prosthecochloris sp. SCSIO W1101]UZJ42135.1 argininosuccinate lyase [Prosthecochloris sp. SCSIO W1101]
MKSSTGRINKLLHPKARRMLFGDGIGDEEIADLYWMSEIDLAHVLMLMEENLIGFDEGRTLLCEIIMLRENRFEPLHGRPMPRGLYLAYEAYLIEHLGPETAGNLHLARSRNDLNATMTKMKARIPVMNLIDAGCTLAEELLHRANELIDVVIPIHTHHQPALPSTMGHYLSAIAQFLSRDLDALLNAASNLRLSPLGAGAVCGTTLPINSDRTAELLGFDVPVVNSIDAVAARDWVLRLESACAIAGIGLGRLATDLLRWTGDMGFARLPDDLVGSSSAMPQKRNPFLLEHIQGRGAALSGAFVASANAMHAMPYTNSVAVGTEACTHLWQPLRILRETFDLMRMVIHGLVIDRTQATTAAEKGYTTATELANRLVIDCGLDFRRAHHAAGEFVNEAERTGNPDLLDAVRRNDSTAFAILKEKGLDPASVVATSAFGGGPAVEPIDRAIRKAGDSINHVRNAVSDWRNRIHSMEDTLHHSATCRIHDTRPGQSNIASNTANDP